MDRYERRKESARVHFAIRDATNSSDNVTHDDKEEK